MKKSDKIKEITQLIELRVLAGYDISFYVGKPISHYDMVWVHMDIENLKKKLGYEN